MRRIYSLTILILASLVLYLYAFSETSTLGYKKFNTIGQYTIYVKPNKLKNIDEVIFTDNENEYLLSNNIYIFKNSFETLTLKQFLLQGKSNIHQVMNIIPDIKIKPIDYIKIGKIGDYIIFEYEPQSNCNPIVDFIYMDSTYEYYFECRDSDKYIVMNNLDKYTLTESLEEKLIKIEELLEIIKKIDYSEIKYYTLGNLGEYEIVQTSCIYDINDEVEVLYEADGKEYYFTTHRSKFYKVKLGITIINLREALAQKLVDIEDIRLIIPKIYVK